MSIEYEFLVYCIEEYKAYHKLTGREVIELFEKYDVNSYIIRNYASMHTTGALYNIQELDDYIKKQRSRA